MWTCDTMEHLYNEQYHTNLNRLYFESGRIRCELDHKIAILLDLIKGEEYTGRKHRAEGELEIIVYDLGIFDKEFWSSTMSFELKANKLLSLRLRVYVCESNLFATLRENMQTRCKRGVK